MGGREKRALRHDSESPARSVGVVPLVAALVHVLSFRWLIEFSDAIDEAWDVDDPLLGS